MASKIYKLYTYHRSRRLARISEDIKRRNYPTPCKKRDTLESKIFQESMKPALLSINTAVILKPELHSVLTISIVESLPIIEVNRKKVLLQMHIILAHIEIVAYIYCFYLKDISFLLKEGTKHFLLCTTILSESKDS